VNASNVRIEVNGAPVESALAISHGNTVVTHSASKSPTAITQSEARGAHHVCVAGASSPPSRLMSPMVDGP
jgi:hypothetical protein